MTIEDDLRESMQRRAAMVHPHPDLDDVGARTAARERRTRRLLTGGLVVALIAGPLAGFAIGHDRDDGTTVAVGGTSEKEIGRSAGDAALSSPALGATGPYEKLFVRTSADGVAIRVYRSTPSTVAVPPPTVCATGGACPAVPECIGTVTPESMIVGELSTDAAVTVASGAANPGAATAVSGATWGTFGIEESAPARWVVASVGTDVTRVRATFPGGTPDEMEPVDGVVLLAGQVDDPDVAGATLEAFDSDGVVVQQVDLTPGFGGMAAASDGSGTAGSGSAESHVELRTGASAGGSGSSASAGASASSSVAGSPGIVADCGPPSPAPAPAPALPPPGEQPADPAAARAAVEHAYSIVYDGSKSADEKAPFQEAPTGITSEQLDASGYGDQVADASAKVTDVVFTTPTTAAVRYDIAVANWSNQFPGRVGGAVLVDGVWKVSHSTLCNDISLAGVACPSK